MNNAQENRLAMFGTTITVCREYEAVWSGVAAFGINLTAFGALADTISLLATAQTEGRKGMTKAKVDATRGLLDQTMLVAGAIGAYAAVTGNAGLEGQVDFSRSEMAKLRDELIDDRAEQVLNLARTHQAALESYGVVAATLDALSARIEAYRALVEAPRMSTVRVKSTTEAIAESFTRADRVLKGVLDRLVLQFKEGSPTFYSAYQNARIILDRGGGRKNGGAQDETAEA